VVPFFSGITVTNPIDALEEPDSVFIWYVYALPLPLPVWPGPLPFQGPPYTAGFLDLSHTELDAP